MPTLNKLHENEEFEKNDILDKENGDLIVKKSDEDKLNEKG